MFEMGDIHKFTDRFVVGSPNILARRPLRCDDNYFAGSYDTQDPLSTTNLNLQVRIYKMAPPQKQNSYLSSFSL